MLALPGEIKNCKFCGEQIRKDIEGHWYDIRLEMLYSFNPWRCTSEDAPLTVLGRVHLPVGELCKLYP